MIELFKRKEDCYEITYFIDQEGLKNLKASMETYDHYVYSGENRYALYEDMDYLKGVADTMPSGKRVLEIVKRIESLGMALNCSISSRRSEIDPLDRSKQ